MIITSIEIDNFMCYAGENKFDFTEGINLIIGDNGYGKSKLYDAFYWALYDKCFDTQTKEFTSTNLLRKSIVSDKAIHDNTSGNIQTSVRVTFQNQEKRKTYIIERYLQTQKDGDEIQTDNRSTEVILEKELEYLNAAEVRDPQKIDLIKKSILPDNIKPYMWFQGEQVESIIDFNKQDTLTQAINVLSNITKFDKIKDIADSLFDSANKEYRKKERDLSGDKTKSDMLELERERTAKQIENLEKQNLQIRDNISTAQEKFNSMLNKMESAERIKALEEKRKNLVHALQETQDEFNEEQISLHNRMFTNKWVLKGTEHLFENFNNRYDSYITKKLKHETELSIKLEAENGILKEMQTRLPIDVPEPIHVERMLADEKCLVCDREAPRGTEPWLKMQELIERSKLKMKDLEEEKSKLLVNDFAPEFKKLYNVGLVLGHQINTIDSDIKSVFRKINRLDKRRKNQQEDLIKLEREINTYVVDAQLTPEEAKNIINTFHSQKDLESRSSRELGNNEVDIKIKSEELERIERDLSNLVTGEIPSYLTEKVKIITDFRDLAHSTRKRIFNSLVKKLEDEANQHYHSMTLGNRSARGIIRLKELSNGKNYMPELIDENGTVLHQLNTGNIILIKLATIMAIISAKQGTKTTDLYTLITDAPMSVLGEDYTIGFCKTVSQVYRQSIIMSKEFYRNTELRNRLFNDNEIKLGKVYLITPSISEEERVNRNSLTTVIKILN
ncbi:AAA family ATPase [Pedobacter sp. D749]|uniref:AAA family ATPase n=1 Tax=Pedobacter sp. D749 TaxID=2856523 RepID=UPI001C5A08F0|nr:AAA family ATPase [Pedobacter sp. D749]QXU41459.1 AAA family ATPase [Pedobacter sp. D749]